MGHVMTLFDIIGGGADFLSPFLEILDGLSGAYWEPSAVQFERAFPREAE
jgi:hypothetical protein